jgi:hypothetical protein
MKPKQSDKFRENAPADKAENTKDEPAIIASNAWRPLGLC